ncbi:cytochrome c peroxidase [Vibrio sp. FNV 38]|nr:cytochrome c peroxidase [Vibrio sp. FNV 38]
MRFKNWMVVLVAPLFVAGCDKHSDEEYHQHETLPVSREKIESRSELVFPLPQVSGDNLGLTRLGYRLFNDPKLSLNGQISCNSCHDLLTTGADPRPVSLGVGGVGSRNSPTVFNVSLNSRFFWDGRANSLESQIDGPIHNPVEMATTWERIEHYLKSSKEYQTLFEAAGIEDIGESSVKEALSHFQKQLITPPSRFDQYLMGQDDALNENEISGWNQFNSRGCILCHQGPNIGGSLYQKFGYYVDRQITSDIGREAITGDKLDRAVFRVPSLRNVTNTAPYFHDGTVPDINSAVYIMGKVQLGQELDEGSIEQITAFLTSLSTSRPVILEELESENR